MKKKKQTSNQSVDDAKFVISVSSIAQIYSSNVHL